MHLVILRVEDPVTIYAHCCLRDNEGAVVMANIIMMKTHLAMK